LAENKIEIEVDVIGMESAQKKLDGIEGSAKGIGESVKGVGESFKGVGAVVSAQGGAMGEAFGALGESVSGVVDGVGQFSEALQSGGKIGVSSILSLLGPISAIVGALALAVEAWRQFSGAAKEAEQIEAAVSAAAGDLTAKMEELADKGIKATSDQLKSLISLNTEARLKLEILNEKNASLTKVYIDQIKAEKDLIAVKKILNGVENLSMFERGNLATATNKLEIANKAVAKAQDELTRGYADALPAIEKAQEYQRNLAMTQQEATDALKAQLEIQKQHNDLLLATSDLSDYERGIQAKEDELMVDRELSAQRNKSIAEIQALTKSLEDENKARSDGEDLYLKEIKNQKELQALKDAEIKRLKDESKARGDAFRARQQQIIGEQSQINALRIQLEKDGIDEQIALAVNTYTTQQQLNKNNKNQLIIAELQYQQQLNSIAEQEIARQQASQLALEQSQLAKIGALQEEAYKEIEIEKTKEQAKKDLTDKIALLDIQLTQTGYDQQIAMLNKQMELELAIVEKGSLAELEIKKRYQLASKDVQGESMQMLGEFAEAQTQAFSASLATAIMTGASVKQVLKETLTGMATEALTKSIFHTAEGFASLALGPIGGLSASQHFAAAGLFAGVASVAGLAGASIPASKASASSGASPSGMAQTTQVQRPEAQKSEPMVFNVNFAGATIYDTKESAKRALSDEIVKYINEPRRGSPRLRVQNAQL
jgi:hypothetical protein